MNLKRVIKGILSISLVLFLFPAAGADENDLTLTYNLSGTLWDVDDSELTVTFSHDMVPLGGRTGEHSILHISPQIDGEFAWRGTKTLAFKPKTRFQFATLYKVTIPAGTRALNGRQLKHSRSWSFKTPSAFPRDMNIADNTGGYQSFNQIEGYIGVVPPEPWDEMIWNRPVWIKASLLLDFDQPVDAKEVKKYLTLAAVQSKKYAAFHIIQDNAMSVRITPAKPLERETVYMLRLKKGFKGIEGDLSTKKNFSYFFKTERNFLYTGSKRSRIPIDSKIVHLHFSNPLKINQPENIKTFKIKTGNLGEDLIPLNEINYDYDPRSPNISISDPLEEGDLLLVKIGKQTLNTYGEILGRDVEIRCRVCSSQRSKINFRFNEGKPKFKVYSIQQLGLKFYRFDEDIFQYLDDPRPRGILSLNGKHNKTNFIDRQFSRIINFDNREWQDIPIQTHLEGLTYGIWGVTVENARPFNVCNDQGIWDYWQRFSPKLHVIQHRDIDFILRTSDTDSMVWVFSRQNGRSIANAPVMLLLEGKRRLLGKTDPNGLLYIPPDHRLTEAGILEASNPGNVRDRVFYRLKKITRPSPAAAIDASIFTERRYYKPGNTVYIGGVVRQIKDEAPALLQPVSGRKNPIRLTVTGPGDQMVVEKNLVPDRFGGFSHWFDTRPDIQKGSYRIDAYYKGEEAGHCFVSIDHFQPDIIEITIKGLKPYYNPDDTFNPLISGAYLSGSPMAGEPLEYSLEISDIYDVESELKTGTRGLAGFSFSLAEPFRGSVDNFKKNARFDNHGRFRPTHPLKRASAINYIAGLFFDVVGKTAEGKEFQADAWRLFFPGDRVTGIKVPRFCNPKTPIDAELAMLSADGTPASGTMDVTLYKLRSRDSKSKPERVSQFKGLEVNKRRSFRFTVQEPGQYRLRCDTKDNSGRVISTSGSFSVWDHMAPSSQHFSADTAQSEYRTGDTARIIIRSKETGQALITIESDRILNSEIIALDKTTIYETRILPSYFPGVTVNIVGLFPGSRTQQDSVRLNVESPEKRLKVDIAVPREFKPGTDARVKFKVTDTGGRGRKAGLFVYAVDEGHLSISNYGTPDLYDYFYSHFLANYFSQFFYQTVFPENYWPFTLPALDIPLGKYGVYGRVTASDGTPLAGVTIVTDNDRGQPVFTTNTSARGYYYIGTDIAENYNIRFSLDGYRTLYERRGTIRNDHLRKSRAGLLELNMVMITAEQYEAYQEQIFWDYGYVLVEDEFSGGSMSLHQLDVIGRQRAIDVRKSQMAAAPVKISVRQDFQPVLFFKHLDTDTNGDATLDFRTSDLLTTYRITAVAYTGSGFGSATGDFTVIKDLSMQETMPEFARQGDTFDAGVLISNRIKKKTTVVVRAESRDLSIGGNNPQRISINGAANQPVNFTFAAPKTGNAAVRFYARASGSGGSDGLLKKLPVSHNHVTETLLDFDVGKEIIKQVKPQPNSIRQQLTLKVAPSVLRPAVKIAERLVLYPYRCLEQQTSRIMPYLVLSDAFLQRLEIEHHREEVRERIRKWIEDIPAFMHRDGALAYYKNSAYASDYLTAYVFWALQLAGQKGFDVPEELTGKIKAYLESGKRNPGSDIDCFYQYILSLSGRASPGVLKRMMQQRQSLSLLGQVFLYKAVNSQLPESQSVKKLPQTFFRHLKEEADFAYCDAPRPSYYSPNSFPFYSNRYATALALHILLETESSHPLIPRMMNWLMECEPHSWNTTQTNFWILYAMDRCMHKFESVEPVTASVDLGGKRYKKNLARYEDILKIEKDLEHHEAGDPRPIDITVKGDRPVYLTTELNVRLETPGPGSRGITVTQNVYDESGKQVKGFKKGQIYQVELLLDVDKNVPYTVIDAPLAAGFELLRQDIATTRTLEEFNRENARAYVHQWTSKEHAPDRVLFYTYGIDKKSRIVYFVKAMYKGEFTWLPTTARGMYHPQFFGRTGITRVKIE